MKVKGSLPIVAGIPVLQSALSLIPALPRRIVKVRQSVAVSFLIGMSLVDFECAGRERKRLSLYKNPIGHLENSLDRRFRSTLYSA